MFGEISNFVLSFSDFYGCREFKKLYKNLNFTKWNCGLGIMKFLVLLCDLGSNKTFHL